MCIHQNYFYPDFHKVNHKLLCEGSTGDFFPPVLMTSARWICLLKNCIFHFSVPEIRCSKKAQRWQTRDAAPPWTEGLGRPPARPASVSSTSELRPHKHVAHKWAHKPLDTTIKCKGLPLWLIAQDLFQNAKISLIEHSSQYFHTTQYTPVPTLMLKNNQFQCSLYKVFWINRRTQRFQQNSTKHTV